jgi:hypothetical protein
MKGSSDSEKSKIIIEAVDSGIWRRPMSLKKDK